MASARQLELARLLAAGVPGPIAMVRAGWPESTARWLGLNAVEYLRKGGVMLPASKPEAAAAAAADKAAPDAAPESLAADAGAMEGQARPRGRKAAAVSSELEG